MSEPTYPSYDAVMHRLKIDRLLEKAGYWYPPDAIQAVADGREEYHPLDSSVRPYRLSAEAKRVIGAALKELLNPLTLEESVRQAHYLVERERELNC